MNIAHAQDAQALACPLIERINEVILYPLISLFMGVALLLFLWGIFQYIVNAEGDAARETGKKHMIFGIIGLVIMVSAVAILQIAAATIGADVPGCR